MTNLTKLAEKLEEIFPNKLPTEPKTEAELSLLIGQQKVIDYIKGLAEDEERTEIV